MKAYKTKQKKSASWTFEIVCACYVYFITVFLNLNLTLNFCQKIKVNHDFSVSIHNLFDPECPLNDPFFLRYKCINMFNCEFDSN